MAIINKPDFTNLWASGGARLTPVPSKIQQGWTPEIPPHQWENWVQYRQDQMLAHVNQRGIAVWDALTEYIEDGKSYVQGSDGAIYRSVAASGPTTTTQDPVTDVAGTYWVLAFASSIDTYTKAQVDQIVADESLVNAIIFG